jgi:hypothetical protein
MHLLAVYIEYSECLPTRLDPLAERPPPINASSSSAAAPPSPGTPTGFDLQYVQGFVNLVRTSEASGGNVVVPKSHLQFESLAREFEGGFRDEKGVWIPHLGVPVGHPIFAGGIRAHLEAGDMFWWDSRTLHGNSSGQYTEVSHATVIIHSALISTPGCVPFSERPCYRQRRLHHPHKGEIHRDDPKFAS